MNFAYYANLRAVQLIFRGFGLTTTESTYHKETFAKNRFSKSCNRKSHQGVKVGNFAKIELGFTKMVTFEVLNMVFRGFGLTTTESTYHKETFA